MKKRIAFLNTICIVVSAIIFILQGNHTSAQTNVFESNSNYIANFQAAHSAFIAISEGTIRRGYWGSFSGAAEDVDLGTSLTNITGKLHLTLRTTPKLTIDTDGDIGIHTQLPAVDLVVHQRQAADANADALVSNPSGLMIEAPDNSAALMYVDGSNDLNFAFGSGLLNIQRAYIRETDGDYFNVSDQKLKTEVQPLDRVLQKLNQLKPVSFHMKNAADSKRTVGFIAQEVQEMFPNMIDEKNGMLALTYSKFAVVAIKAIQEQQEIIKALTKRIENLERNQN